jgi:hypothetical protein
MQVGELFVAIGVKGVEKTVSAFENVYKGIDGVKKVSLEAKAAILSAIYAFEKLSQSAIQTGTHLGSVASYLGIGVKELQQWEYAAQQAGISNEQFESSLMSVYKVISDIRSGEGAPKWFSFFAQNVGGVDLEKAYQNPFYLLQKIQQFARSKFSGEDLILRNKALEGFGLSPDFIGKITNKDVFSNPYQFKPGFSFLSDTETKKLTDLGVQWDNLGQKIKMFFAHFTAKNGKDILDFFDNMTNKIIFLTQKLEEFYNVLKKISSSLGITDFIKKASSIRNPFEPLPTDKTSVEKKEILEKEMKKSENLFSKPMDFIFDKYNEFLDKLSNIFDFIPNNQQAGIITPPTPLLPSQPGNTTSASVNQNIYFQHAGNDYNRVKDSMKQVILDTWNQLPPHVQAT